MSSLDHEYDVFAFNETLFAITHDAVQLEDYGCEVIRRLDKNGNGVALYIKDKFVYEVISEYTVVYSSFESLFIKTNVFVFGVIYRPLSGSLDEFFRFVESMLDFFRPFRCL